MPLTPAQVQVEGQTLAMYLLCLNDANMQALQDPAAAATQPANFQKVPPAVYTAVRNLVVNNTGQYDHVARLAAFKQSFAEAANSTLALPPDGYPPPDDSCLTDGTGANLQTPGLIP